MGVCCAKPLARRNQNYVQEQPMPNTAPDTPARAEFQLNYQKQHQQLPPQPQAIQHQQQNGRHVQMRALFNFDPQVKGDLQFRKDDILELLNDSDEFWWFMEHTESRQRGYVPYNYVQPFDGGPTSMAAWFDIDRREAERNLLMPGLPNGCYVLRPCTQRPNKDTVSLSVRTEDPTSSGKHFIIKHYMVKPTDQKGFYISPRKTFHSMQNLIRHYQNSEDGLCCRLTLPCPRKYVPPPQFRDFEINPNQLTLVEKLGQGSFGEVWRAKLGRLVDVAVKQMRPGTMNQNEFIDEAKILHKLHHPKIVQLLGVCTTAEPFYIVTELMPNGALSTYLKEDNSKSQSVTYNDMIDMLCQISDGMSYLEAKKYIHRDLRAANILVGLNNTVKVGDFGLSKLLEEDMYQFSENTKFPIRWTAPEAAVRREFTTKSDVWSFGILIYEIVTRGGIPYREFSNKVIMSMVSREDYRMPNPHNPGLGIECDQFLYNEVMLRCWAKDPNERPLFSALKSIFENYWTERQHQYE